MDADYTLANLSKITGAKRRSVQLWAEAGVIQAQPTTERAGTGTHRRFSRNEAIIACIIHAFAIQRRAIGELLTISRAVRSHIAGQGIGRGNVRSMLEAAIAGTEDVCLLYTTGHERGPRTTITPISYKNEGAATTELAALGACVLTDLEKPFSISTVILLNSYLTGLR